MGKHLERAGAPFRQPEWSALALIEDPDAVRTAHEAFIASGAQVITTNAYAVVPFHLGEERFAERAVELAALAGRLAREAVDRSGRSVLVAGSLPPLFGSYQPELFDPGSAPELYRMLVEAQAPWVDLWLGETISSIGEAVAIADAVETGPGPDSLWLSFTVPDVIPVVNQDEPDEAVVGVPLRSGESIADAVDAVGDRCEAILFNCSPPEVITSALAELVVALSSAGRQLPIGAYANAFEPRPEEYAANEVLLGAREELTPERYTSIAESWVVLGATLIGGCCQIHTEHIESLAEHFGE